MRNYFMKLRMSLLRVRNAKKLREEMKLSSAAVDQDSKTTGVKSTLNELTPKEASAAFEA